MRNVFDVVAPQYIREDKHWGCDLDIIVQALSTCLNRQTRTRYLDVGCGPGFHIASVARLFPEVSVTGLDYSIAMLCEATSALLHLPKKAVELKHADILEFPVTEQYEVVSFLNNGLGNIRSCEVHPMVVRVKAVRKMRELLREKNQLIVSVYNREKLGLEYGENLKILPHSDIEHGDLFVEYLSPLHEASEYYSHWFMTDELIELLEQNGFKVELLEKRMARLVIRAIAT